MVMNRLVSVAPQTIKRGLHTTKTTNFFYMGRIGNFGGDHEPDNRGVVGSNLPFPIYHKYRLVLMATLYFASGMAVPALMIRHALLKA